MEINEIQEHEDLWTPIVAREIESSDDVLPGYITIQILEDWHGACAEYLKGTKVVLPKKHVR